MKSLPFQRLATFLAVCLCLAAVPSLWPHAQDVRVDDRNGDGVPDVWRLYDRNGQLSEVAVDTNFDGRPDVQEYYERGSLIRRESDRDFDDQVDVVEEFDPTTHEHVRSIIDVDRDGAADLLILFRGNQRVFTKWAGQLPSSARRNSIGQTYSAPRSLGHARLTALRDPFLLDRVWRAIRPLSGFDDFLGLSTSGGLPASQRDVVTAVASPSRIPVSPSSPASSFAAVPGSPRGPPFLYSST